MKNLCAVTLSQSLTLILASLSCFDYIVRRLTAHVKQSRCHVWSRALTNCPVRTSSHLKHVLVPLGRVVAGLEVRSDGEGGTSRLETGFLGIGGVGGGVLWILDTL